MLVLIIISNTDEGRNTPLGYHTDQAHRALALRCFLLLLPNYIHVYAIVVQLFSYFYKREVLQQEYSQPPKLPSPHFRWVVNLVY